jgi:hypothetical protein
MVTMMIRPSFISLAAAVLLHATISAAIAQDLSGRYSHQGAQGEIALLLQQDTEGRVTGTLSAAGQSAFALRGTVDGRRATGTIVIGGEAAWFAAGFSGDTLVLLVAEIDASTGAPNLDAGWRLDFLRHATNVASPPAAASAAAAAEPPSALVQEWLQHLRGRRVTFISRGGGQGGGWQQRADYFLCSDGTFHYRESSSVAAEVPGVIGHGGGRSAGQGTWRIIERAGNALIEYRLADGGGDVVPLSYQNGATFIDGTRAYVTDQNDVCP